MHLSLCSPNVKDDSTVIMRAATTRVCVCVHARVIPRGHTARRSWICFSHFTGGELELGGPAPSGLWAGNRLAWLAPDSICLVPGSTEIGGLWGQERGHRNLPETTDHLWQGPEPLPWACCQPPNTSWSQDSALTVVSPLSPTTGPSRSNTTLPSWFQEDEAVLQIQYFWVHEW